jgi:hypothetical protein
VDIKNIKPNGNWKSGKFLPKNPEKYIGDIHNIIYRSSWERKFCHYCDINPNILRWSSEPTAIPYWSPIDKKTHKYFVDYYIQVKKEKSLENWFIEVKPANQYKLKSKPKIKGNITEKKLRSHNERMKVWITNRAKFEAATRYAESMGYKFGAVDESFTFR